MRSGVLTGNDTGGATQVAAAHDMVSSTILLSLTTHSTIAVHRFSFLKAMCNETLSDFKPPVLEGNGMGICPWKGTVGSRVGKGWRESGDSRDCVP